MTTKGRGPMTRAKRLRLIARAELRRRWRTMKGNNAVVGAAFRGHHAASVLDRRGFGAYLAGGFVARRDRATHRMGPVAFRLRVDIRGRIRWIPRVRRGVCPDNLDGLLTAVSHRDLISGLLLTELAPGPRSSSQSAAPLGRVFAVGAGSLLTIPALLLTLCLFTCD